MNEEMTGLEDSGGDDVPTAPFWMTTFSDMMTLLLAFFVMIVAMSEVEVKKFKKALSHFQGRTSVLMHESSVVPSPHSRVSTERFQSKEQARRYREFVEYLKENDLEDKVEAKVTKNGIHVVIADSLMFRSGQAHLIEPSRTVLRMLAGLISEEVTTVIVEGHTDDRPISTDRFPSNWELSTARAASSVRFLQRHTPDLDPSRYSAVGYGPYHPRDTTGTPTGRARNRRVEILFDWRSWNDPKKTPTHRRRPRP